MTNSLTAFELAPGVLKTTIPFFVASSTGILLNPAPALAIDFKFWLKSLLINVWLLIKIASGSLSSYWKFAFVRNDSACSEILLNVLNI